MITVACVYKSGGEYTAEYVNRLARAVHQSLNLPHVFVCLTDAPDRRLGQQGSPNHILALNHDWPTWWGKMELFALPGPVLCFDLDTVLVGSIDELAAWIIESQDSILMLRGFYRKDQCSGILGWNGDLSWILTSFIAGLPGSCWRRRPNAVWLNTKAGQYRGDQEWLSEFLKAHPELPVVLAQDVFPRIQSFKVDVRLNGSLSEGTRIVCFHGHPRPHEVNPLPDWMVRHWKGSTVAREQAVRPKAELVVPHSAGIEQAEIDRGKQGP